MMLVLVKLAGAQSQFMLVTKPGIHASMRLSQAILQLPDQGDGLPQQGFYDSGLGGLTPLPGAVYLDASLPPSGVDGVQPT